MLGGRSKSDPHQKSQEPISLDITFEFCRPTARYLDRWGIFTTWNMAGPSGRGSELWPSRRDSGKVRDSRGEPTAHTRAHPRTPAHSRAAGTQSRRSGEIHSDDHGFRGRLWNIRAPNVPKTTWETKVNRMDLNGTATLGSGCAVVRGCARCAPGSPTLAC